MQILQLRPETPEVLKIALTIHRKKIDPNFEQRHPVHKGREENLELELELELKKDRFQFRSLCHHLTKTNFTTLSTLFCLFPLTWLSAIGKPLAGAVGKWLNPSFRFVLPCLKVRPPSHTKSKPTPNISSSTPGFSV
ncbi:hypothetical protein L6164_004581 [Bauhinia variegata]|uniref:Uncharacterized protein n=1 Tax=Bauhinia variegata TaxID=167791 RepID=A0ACB9Q7K8_BAUVA|nr:hypothetical protein L6164_004581 [Bauhinia variegata]